VGATQTTALACSGWAICVEWGAAGTVRYFDFCAVSCG
jgi:hypothetical protein